ncbi:hypothetical protein GFY24_00770 [Nocardia sp. SYP-A9097]|uniref:hypothetical protein n=1 Tax=Nocardia sp. SYP-A9097 TaxID=2663237 RepID=UPI00129ABBCE|nr:hypothetical protein [Nocardia sp. SYP-A9097]MRH86010.1 hypothetical protein [Nocardia sp. SYP-A9097]
MSIEFAPEWEDGEETSLKKADGRYAFLDKSDDQLKWVQTTIQFTSVNPDALGLILGQPVVLDHAGNAVGIRLGQVVATDWALETWTDIPGVACAEGKPYGYFLAPWLHGGRLASFTINNGNAEFKIENARTRPNSLWGTGPYLVELNEATVPTDPPVPGKLLTPIAADQQLQMTVTFVPPPAVACAATALVLA